LIIFFRETHRFILRYDWLDVHLGRLIQLESPGLWKAVRNG